MTSDAAAWPHHLQPDALRRARSSVHRDDTVAFHRDLVGPPIVGSFHASSGEDGTTSGLPGTRTRCRDHRGDLCRNNIP